jgi:hypothetical protein
MGRPAPGAVRRRTIHPDHPTARDGAMSKYTALRARLRQDEGQQLELTFAEIERLVGGLPPTALTTRQWWGNNRSGHTQAAAWLDAGRQVIDVDFDNQRVTFSRAADRPAEAPQRSAAQHPAPTVRPPPLPGSASHAPPR